jgi:acyl-CoA synthetase
MSNAPGRPSTLGPTVHRLASTDPDGVGFIDASTGAHVTWSGYEGAAEAVAARIAALGLGPRARVAVAAPDGIDAHKAFLGCEMAGVVAVGIGAKSGRREASHIASSAGSVAVLATTPLAEALGLRDAGLPFVDLDTASRSSEALSAVAAPIAFNDDELWFLNSTSGTTGLPKLVRHNQSRWFAFHDEAVLAGRMTDTDVFATLLPAPFGFGLWTGHFTPTILGRPCVVSDRFDPGDALRSIERDRVTILAAVPTQLAMLLAAGEFATTDFSSLRAVFTGGEMLPYARAVEFEDRTGAALLQFYGATETGALSRTMLDDDRETRLRTAGRLLPTMHVRLIDDDDADVTATGGPAVPVCKGPLLALGYEGDEAANAALYTADGSVRMPDLVTIDPPGDPNGVLSVVGRTSDLIIRGGKNISAVQVEDEVATHPGVALVAAVAIPDAVFGERVCAYIVAHTSTSAETAVSLDSIRAHLAARGVGRELWPEHLVLVEGDLPRNSGGKVAKSALRADATRRAADQASAPA